MPKIGWDDYEVNDFWDELITSAGEPRPAAADLACSLAKLSERKLQLRQTAAERAIVEMGVTFTVYSEGQNIDRAWPFDIIPRVLSAAEWRTTEAGLKQRLRALNMFIDDVYHDRRIVAEGPVADVLGGATIRDLIPAGSSRWRRA